MTDDPYDPDNPDYQKFLESCNAYCRCLYGPCDGVLAGGLCDGLDENYWDGLADDL